MHKVLSKDKRGSYLLAHPLFTIFTVCYVVPMSRANWKFLYEMLCSWLKYSN